MSNINRLNNSIVNDDNMEQHVEINTESTMTDQTHSSNRTSISMEESTFRAETVVERSIPFNDTNQTINDLTAYGSTTRRSSLPGDDSNVLIGESRAWMEESIFDYVFAANRDELPNSRIRFPSDDVNNVFSALLSASIINRIFNYMLNTIPFGIQDTQPHTLILPVFVSATPTDININNENGDINEDGTNFIDDDSINTITTETHLDQELIVRESDVAETMDDFTNNADPTTFTDAHNTNNHHEQFLAHEDSSNNDGDATHLLRGQVSPGEDNTEIPDDVQTNAPVATSSVPTTAPSGQAEEIEQILNEPTDNANHPGSDSTDLLAAGLNIAPLNTQNQKQTNLLNTSENIDDMQR